MSVGVGVGVSVGNGVAVSVGWSVFVGEGGGRVMFELTEAGAGVVRGALPGKDWQAVNPRITVKKMMVMFRRIQ